MYLLKLLIIIIFILLPFGESLRFDIGNNIVLKPLDIAVGIAALTWLVISIISKRKMTKYFILNTLYLLLFPAIALFALLLNIVWLKPTEFMVSFFYWLRWVSYLSILPIVFDFDREFKKKIIVFLTIIGFLFVLFGYIQYFFYQSLKNLYYLGWDEHMHRIFSTFFDPNFAGCFYVLLLLFFSGLWYKNHMQSKNIHKKNVLLSFLLVLTLIALFLTFSRSALVMLIVASVIFLTLIHKKKFILIIIGVLVAFFIIASPKFHDENMDLLRIHSVQARFQNYAGALKIIADRPLLGVGFDSYRYAKLSYGFHENWTSAPSHADAGVDNSFLFIVATTGIVGFFAFIYLWFTLLKKAYLRYCKEGNIMAIILISSVLSLFVDAFFINSLFYSEIMLWIWIIAGLTVSTLL